MAYNVVEDFERLRNEWALKANVSKDTLDLERSLDQRANPHNEPYHNKKPRRTDNQIIADRSYSFADEVLTRQYGRKYTEWLAANFDADEQWKTGYKRTRL